MISGPSRVSSASVWQGGKEMGLHMYQNSLFVYIGFEQIARTVSPLLKTETNNASNAKHTMK